MGLGIIALMIGMGCAGAGAYIGFATSRMLVALPAGLPAMAPETVAMAMFMVGALTMLLGILNIYHSTDDDSRQAGDGLFAGVTTGPALRGPGGGGKRR